MIESKSCCQMMSRSAPMPSPFDEVIAFGYEDGPTQGILRCGGCHREYYFELIDSRGDDPDDHDTRIYALSPIARGSLDEFTETMAKYQQPRRPFWLPIWSFPSEQDRDRMNALVDRIVGGRGPVEWVFASSSWLDGRILSGRPVSIGEFDQAQNWFAILGLVKTAIGD